MREIFERYGFAAPRVIQAAQPKTEAVRPLIYGPAASGGVHRRRLARNWKTLLSLAESPVPARAISLIRDKIMALDWQIKPKPGLEDEDFEDEAAAVAAVLDNPNVEDEDWPTFIGPVVEDLLTFDSAGWEYVERPPFIAGNDLLALCTVPGFTLERAVGWDGDPARPRWAQRLPGVDKAIPLLDHDVEVLIHRKRSSLPYGFSPLEVVVGLMDAWLQLSSYQSQVASEAYPAFMVHLGEEATEDQVRSYRIYWENELRGQGRPGFFGGTKAPSVLQTKGLSDGELYLQYYEQLVRTIAFVFKLKPQDFGVERDVNRSQGEISQSASIEEAVKPYASLIARRLTARVIPRIAELAGDARIADLVFIYPNIDPWDEKEQAEILRIHMQSDLVTVDEGRSQIGRAPLENGLGGATLSEYRSQFQGAAPLPEDDLDDDGVTAARLAAARAKKKILRRSATTRSGVSGK